MRILHTADWHLGQSFYGYRRYDEHADYLDWLTRQAETLQADALLVAGDVFDLSNPAAEAQAQYYDFLHRFRLRCPHCRIYIIAGNHDSPLRLEAPRALLAHHHIYVVGRLSTDKANVLDTILETCLSPLYERKSEPNVTEQTETVAAYLLSIPYPGFGRLFAGGDYGEQMADFITRLAYAAHQRIREKVGQPMPLIGMGHFFAASASVAEEDEHERIIGSLEQISVEPFASQFDYFALGHLHRRQQVANHRHIRYAGSPLSMSFSERQSEHGALQIDLVSGGESPKISFLPFEQSCRLIRIPSSREAPVSQLERELQTLPDTLPPESFSPFVEINLRAQDNTPAVADQLRGLISDKPYRLTRIVARRSAGTGHTDSDGLLSSPQEMEEIKLPGAIDLADRYYQAKYRNPMPQEMRDELAKAVAEAENQGESSI